MTPHILFWFYRDFDVCRERLGCVRRFNPDVRIYGLFGGPLDQADAAQRATGELIDDLYIYPEPRSPEWKWRHGDQLIARWHKDRGRRLDWDTIFIMQWDMLIAAPLGELFAMLRPGEALLSGDTPMSRVAAWWIWARPDSMDLFLFRKLLRLRFGYTGELFACQFIVPCLPRALLDRYIELGHPLVGFLEYKIPTLARIFEIPICTDHPFDPWWSEDPATKSAPPSQRVLNASSYEIPHETIHSELQRDRGARMFHPVSGILPSHISARIEPSKAGDSLDTLRS